MKRKTLFILGVIVVLLVIGFFYINNILLPVKIKQFIITRAETFLDRTVSIEAVHFTPIEGFILTDIKVYDREAKDKIFLSADRVSLNIILTSLFQKKQVIIPQIKLTKPFIYINRKKKNNWNFSDLLENKTSARESSKEKKPRDFFLRKVLIENGTINYADQTKKDAFIETVMNIHLALTLKLDKTIDILFESQIPRRDSSLSIMGTYDLSDKLFSSTVSLKNIHLAKYLSAFDLNKNPRLLDGVLSCQEVSVIYQNKKIQLRGNLNAKNTQILYQTKESRTTDIADKDRVLIAGNIDAKDALITWHNQRLELKGKITIPASSVILGANKTIRGDLSGTLEDFSIVNKNIHLKGSLALANAYIDFVNTLSFTGNIEALNADLSKQNKIFSIKGNYFTTNSDLTLLNDNYVKGDIFLINSALIYKNKEFSLTGEMGIKNAALSVLDKNKISGEISASGLRLTKQQDILALNSKIQINHADIIIDEDKRFYGNPSIDITCQYDTNKKTPVQYSGSASVLDASVSGIPLFESLESISGVVTFENDQIKTDRIAFRARETKIKLSGQLLDFSNPDVDLTFSSDDLDIENFSDLLGEKLSKTNIDIKGNTSLTAHYLGALKKPKEAQIKVNAHIKTASVSSPTLAQDIQNISGKIAYEKDYLLWQNLTGIYLGKQYTLNGTLNDFSRPTVEAEIFAEKLSAYATLNILRNAFQIVSLKGDYLNSSFDLKGDVHLPPEAEPDLDIRGNVIFDLIDLPKLLPNYRRTIYRIDPHGVLTIKGLFKGTPKDWKNWQLTFDAESSSLRIKNIPLYDAFFHYAQRDQNISKCDLTSWLYGGKLQVNSKVDLQDSTLPVQLKSRLSQLDLAELRRDNKIKATDIKGQLSLALGANFPLTNIKEVEGLGAFTIENGYLGSIELIEGLMKALNKVPGFLSILSTGIAEGSDVTKTRKMTKNYIVGSKGSFTIKDKKIHSKDVMVLGTIYDLDIDGWIDFQKNINIVATPNARRFADKHGPATQFLGSPVSVRITGKPNQLHYEPIVDPISPIKDAVGATIDVGGDTIKVIGDILGNFLDEF